MSYRLLAARPLQQTHVAAGAARDPRAGGAGRRGRRRKSRSTRPASPIIRPSSPSLNDRALRRCGTGVQTVGKGKVYAGQNAEAALKALNVAPDFDHTKPENGHRSPSCIASWPTATSTSSITATTATQLSTPPSASPAKRPSCGMQRPARRSPRRSPSPDGRTTVPLHLEPWGTVFVVFRKPATANVAHSS